MASRVRELQDLRIQAGDHTRHTPPQPPLLADHAPDLASDLAPGGLPSAPLLAGRAPDLASGLARGGPSSARLLPGRATDLASDLARGALLAPALPADRASDLAGDGFLAPYLLPSCHVYSPSNGFGIGVPSSPITHIQRACTTSQHDSSALCAVVGPNVTAGQPWVNGDTDRDHSVVIRLRETGHRSPRGSPCGPKGTVTLERRDNLGISRRR